MVYNHVNFNQQWAASKSTAEFIEHESHNGLSEDQLREAHALCVAEVAPLNPEVGDASEEPA